MLFLYSLKRASESRTLLSNLSQAWGLGTPPRLTFNCVGVALMMPLSCVFRSVRPDKRFRLALGSFVEEYNNKVQVRKCLYEDAWYERYVDVTSSLVQIYLDRTFIHTNETKEDSKKKWVVNEQNEVKRVNMELRCRKARK